MLKYYPEGKQYFAEEPDRAEDFAKPVQIKNKTQKEFRPANEEFRAEYLENHKKAWKHPNRKITN